MRSFPKLVPFAFITGSLVLATSSPALAQQRGFALDRFDPSDRGSEWFVADSLDLRGHLRPAAGGVIGAWAYKPLVAYDANGNEQGELVRHQLFVHPGLSAVFFNRIRGGLSLPIGVFQNGEAITTTQGTYRPPRGTVGDLRISSDVRLFGEHGGPVTGALGFAFYVPTGSRTNYTSDGTVRFTPRASVAGDISYFTYAARVGFAYRPLDETYDRNPLGSEIQVSAAAGLRVADKKLVIGPEFFGSTIVDSDSFWKRRGTPAEWMIGAHYSISDFRFGGGVGTGLTRGWGTPTLRAFLGAEWTPGLVDDADKDGIADKDDACPNTPGIRTSDPRTNGCPPPPPIPLAPADRDGDGILDNEDACPDQAGVRSADAAKNGCPSDRDSDGVWDAVDACPDVQGKPNNDPSKNGCPADRDADGIADEKDACPDQPGVKSEDPTTNGCPPDRDGDSITDLEDACPDAPGPADADPKHNGCPLARIEDGQIKIVEQVKFKTGSTEILRDSDPTLLAVATMLKDHPELTKIRVEGHTDNKGNQPTNAKLSQGRAEAVVKWMLSYGLAKKRFTAKGFGPTHPIDTNETDQGRQNNRRVEFHIDEMGAGPPGKGAPPEPMMQKIESKPLQGPGAAPTPKTAPAPKTAPPPAKSAPPPPLPPDTQPKIKL